jgi:hypothetical protein
MSTTFVYRRGAELPGLRLPWQEQTGTNAWSDLDLSTGYTFTLTLISDAGAATLTKTGGIVGGVGYVDVLWAVNELDIAAGDYTAQLRARETATSKDRDYSPQRPLRISIVGAA